MNEMDSTAGPFITCQTYRLETVSSVQGDRFELCLSFGRFRTPADKAIEAHNEKQKLTLLAILKPASGPECKK